MGPIRVDSTKIFARAAGGRQLLVYSMRLDAAQDVAMILPVPVPAGGGEDALRFIDLSGREHFFDALDRCWPKILGLSPQRQPQTLVVRTIGSFEASYVPTVADFARLDPRFRLAKGVWQALPMYADWGFAVFRLRAGAQQVHPMAFEFPTRVPDALYFPTVHVHDGRVHRKARFAHTLYFQGPQRIEPLTEVLGHTQPKWRSEWYAEVTGPPRQLLGPQLGLEFDQIVDLDLRMVRTYLFGDEPNADVWLAGPRTDNNCSRKR
ncbi:MAG: hypothetical protein IPO88_00465 [Nannocystis sp.]|uniref:hypothetical protein n=1 Tax=Nannocystis sp. TaxID=1962667 RepID=UPI0024239657|nr:hypothetical protein [Nannocystis sp.]MBK9751976.1 hypothetical protein [Nannocystis sp.]